MARLGGTARWVIGLAFMLLAAPGHAQLNIDAGRSPAELFADGCSVCHRTPYDLKAGSAEFLRRHYMPGAKQAAAMAAYLEQVRSEPPPAPPARIRRPSPSTEDDTPSTTAMSETAAAPPGAAPTLEPFEE